MQGMVGSGVDGGDGAMRQGTISNLRLASL